MTMMWPSDSSHSSSVHQAGADTPFVPPARREGESGQVYSYRVRHAYHVWMGTLSDGAFWDWVLLRHEPGESSPDDYDTHDPYEGAPGPTTLSPCPTCGSLTSCANDEEGRPLIHATPEDTDEDGDPIPDWWAGPPLSLRGTYLPGSSTE
jgi:hypothetical protein